MSIDAHIKAIVHNEDGSGELCLDDRPGGCRGQSSLRFDASPIMVSSLLGADVWGSSSNLMLGEREIARRDGYTKIVFVNEAAFNRAVADYKLGLKVKESKPPEGYPSLCWGIKAPEGGWEYKYFEAHSDNFGGGSIEELNCLLVEGWEPVRETPMGGGGSTETVSSLVLLRRPKGAA